MADQDNCLSTRSIDVHTVFGQLIKHLQASASAAHYDGEHTAVDVVWACHCRAMRKVPRKVAPGQKDSSCLATSANSSVPQCGNTEVSGAGTTSGMVAS